MSQTAVAKLCETLEALTTDPTSNGYETDCSDSTMEASINMCKVKMTQESQSVIQVRANFEHAKAIGTQWSFSDSGADTSVLGSHAGNIIETGRHADLVGYDPDSTKTPRVPIVSGMIPVCHLPKLWLTENGCLEFC